MFFETHTIEATFAFVVLGRRLDNDVDRLEAERFPAEMRSLKLAANTLSFVC